jgi:hypothetical protein
MASNIAHRRAAKAARPKKVLTSRRASEPASLADNIKRLAGAPLHCCLLHREEAETGIGSVFLARKVETGEVALAAFLIDTFALGVKDVFFHRMESSDFDDFLSGAGAAAPIVPVDPAFARKLIRSAAAYAASIGLRGPRDFAAIERFFGDNRAEDCTEEFVFGRNGKPLYVVGPTETARQVASRVNRLVERLGPDCFNFAIPGPAGDEADAA